MKERLHILRGFAAIAVVVVASVFACFAGADAMAEQTDEPEAAYAYRLEFSDETALGVNSGDTAYADATVHGTAFTRVAGPKAGTYGVQFPQSDVTPFTNYFSLPTAMFAGTTQATIAGWFKVPSDIGAWVAEMCIHSPDNENNKALRADPYAPNSRNGYLYVYGNNAVVDGAVGERYVTPLYDRWQHIAYVMNGSTLTVYQNGIMMRTVEDANMSPEKLHSATSTFLIGQNAYESGHPDYNGAISDVRVYRKALTEDEIASEFSLEYTDFLTAEYTFDDETDPYKENVHGYNGASLRPHEYSGPTTDPVIVKDGDESVMRLDGKSAFVIAHNNNGGLNNKMPNGHSALTISMDIKLNGELATQTGWERIWDIIVDKGGDATGYITAMAHREPNSSMELIYGNTGSSQKWLFNSTGKSFVLPTDEWINLTYVITSDYIEIYANGFSVIRETVTRPISDILYDFSTCSAYFTIGSPVHESNRRLAADYDNIRIWAYALDGSNVMEVVSGNPLVSGAIAKISLDGETRYLPAGVEYTLPVPEKDGYDFGGWYDNAEYTGSAVAKITPDSDAAYYSKWFKRYAVTYVADGGTHDNPAIYSEQTAAQLLPAEKEGYNFVGWFDAATDGNKIMTLVGQSSDLTLYARFEEKSFTLTLDIDTANASFTVKAGERTIEQSGKIKWSERVVTVTASVTDEYSAYVLFDGAPLSADEHGVYAVTMTADGTLKCYAAEKGYKLTVAFDANMGSVEIGGTPCEAGTLTIARDFVGDYNVTAKHGYYIKSITLGEKITPEYGTASKQAALSLAADASLEVEFAALNTYTLAFGGNGGEGEIEAATLLWSDEYVLPECHFAKLGHHFAGWGVTADGEAAYKPGDKVQGLTQNVETVTLYAVWEINKYTLRFDLAGGSGENDDVALSYGQKYAITQTATKHGYTFIGWGVTADGIEAYRKDDSVQNLTLLNGETVTLHAKYVRNTYTVTLVTQSGNKEVSVMYREGIRLSDYIKPDEKTPSGWKVGDVGLDGDGIVFVYGDLTATAEYAEDKDAAAQNSTKSAEINADGENSGNAPVIALATLSAVFAAIAIAVCLCRRKTIR